jgi:tetratricopeptide (TPR) repeat protein
MKRAGALAALFGLAILVAPAAAHATPSVWAMARDPSIAARQAVLAEVDTLLIRSAEARRTSRDRGMAAIHLIQARDVLEAASAGTSPDPLLRLRLAIVLEELAEHGPLGNGRNMIERATALYLSVGKNEHAPAYAREKAWASVAICFAHLDRPEDEIKAYDEALVLQPDQSRRAQLLANRAEAHMVMGNLTSAIDGYRAALSELSRAPAMRAVESTPTTLWGLAVALDRSGDLATALDTIVIARSYDPTDSLINGPFWFYVPDYDEAWYHALGHWTAARHADLDSVRAEFYARAVTAWEDYILRAKPDDRWLPLAKARLALCEKERDAFQRRARIAPSKTKSRERPLPKPKPL